MGKVLLYDTKKKLNRTSDHAIFDGCEVVEMHKNSFKEETANGTEVLYKQGFTPDELDKAILAIGAKYWKDRGLKPRSDLYNMNLFAKRGTSYRLVEVCFISSPADEAIYDTNFESYCQDMAKLLTSQKKNVYLVAGHGAGDPGALGLPGRQDEDKDVRDICNRIYEIANKLSNNTSNGNASSDDNSNSGSSEITKGDTVEIIYPHDKYIADGYQYYANIHQTIEYVLAGGKNSWNIKDNGIPQAFLNIVDENYKKKPNSDSTIIKKGDLFKFNRNFKVVDTVMDYSSDAREKVLYLKLDGGLGSKYYFWVIASRCKKV